MRSTSGLLYDFCDPLCGLDGLVAFDHQARTNADDAQAHRHYRLASLST